MKFRILATYSALILLAYSQAVHAASANSLERGLREQRQTVNQAQRAVAERTRQLRDAHNDLRQARRPFDEARQARLAAEQAVAAHEGVLETLEHQEWLLVQRLGEELDANRVGPYLNTLERQIEELTAQRERIQSDTNYQQHMADLQHAWQIADDAYWEERRRWERTLQRSHLAESGLAATEAQLDDEQTKFADLRLEAMQASSNVLPAYLARVTVEQDGDTVYAAEWIERRVEIDEQIRVLRDLRDDQKTQVIARKAGFDAAYQDLERMGDQMDALSAEYEFAIHAQKWRTIATQIGGAAINIAVGGGSPVAVLTELASRLADIPMTDYTARYDLPVLGSGGLEPAAPTTRRAITDATINRYKETILGLVQGFVGGQLEIRALPRFRAEVWVRPKLNDLAARPLADVARSARDQLLAIRNGREAGAFIKESASRTLRDINYRNLGTSLGTGFAVDLAESAVLERARASRVDTFRRWIDFDAQIAVSRLALQTQRILWQQDRAQLIAIHRALNEVLELRNQVTLERVLRPEMVDATVERDVQAHVQLTFSRDVESVSASLGTHHLTPAGQNRVYDFTLSPEDMAELADFTQIEIGAWDMLQRRSIDHLPETKPYLTDRGNWANYEAGVDRHHLLNFSGQSGRASVSLVLDLSGSMEEQLAGHIASLRQALHSDTWRAADEFALWVFQGTDIRLVQPFTVDRTILEQALEDLRTDGGTPLTRAIIQSGSHLLASGRYPNKQLLIFTDGEDTEDRDPAIAIRQLQAQRINVSQR